MTRKNSFAANVLPTITPATKVVAPGEPTMTLTESALRELISSAVTTALAGLSGTPAPALVAPAKARKAPVQAPVVTAKAAEKPAHRGTGIGMFSTGKVCMLTCQDGAFNSTKTAPPAGEQFPVLFEERVDRKASMETGSLVKLPEETRIYSVKEWKRNSKNTGWIALFPKKIA
jgi:hypothetical protein